MLGVQDEQFVDEVDGMAIPHNYLQSLPDLPSHAFLQVVVDVFVQFQILYFGPYVGRYGSTKSTDEVQLFQLAVSLQYGSSGPQLCHDATDSPHVYRGAIVALPQQELGGPVPKGDDPVRVSVSEIFVDIVSPGQSKISKFEDSILRHEDVGGLEVSVKDFVVVDVK